jgi:hypothetical protein
MDWCTVGNWDSQCFDCAMLYNMRYWRRFESTRLICYSPIVILNAPTGVRTWTSLSQFDKVFRRYIPHEVRKNDGTTCESTPDSQMPSPGKAWDPGTFSAMACLGDSIRWSRFRLLGRWDKCRKWRTIAAWQNRRIRTQTLVRATRVARTRSVRCKGLCMYKVRDRGHCMPHWICSGVSVSIDI